MNVVRWLYDGLAWTWGGYRFRSGAAGYNIFSGPLAFAGILRLAWQHAAQHRCHVRRCWRPVWHPHPVHGHPVCRRHHPQSDVRLDP